MPLNCQAQQYTQPNQQYIQNNQNYNNFTIIKLYHISPEIISILMNGFAIYDMQGINNQNNRNNNNQNNNQNNINNNNYY